MNESIIFIGIAFYLVYLANSFENPFLKLFLKLFSTFVVMVIAYIPLFIVNLGDQTKLYDLFAWAIMTGITFFWVIWFTILIKEALEWLGDWKKNKYNLEDVQ